MPADLKIYLGPSYPSVTALPNPNAWQKVRVKIGAMNEMASGNAVFHDLNQVYEWTASWDDLTQAEANAILTEYQRTRKLAFVDFDSSSYTVVVQPRSLELQAIPGTNPIAWNVRVAFRELPAGGISAGGYGST